MSNAPIAQGGVKRSVDQLLTLAGMVLRSIMPACHRVRPLIFVKFPITTILVPSGLTSNLYSVGLTPALRESVSGRLRFALDGPVVVSTAARFCRARFLIVRTRLHVEGLSPHVELMDRARG